MGTIHSSEQASGSGIHLKFPRISGFTVLEHLHEGSHSSLYRARQDRLGRVVALKVLPEWPPPTDVALERFNRATYVAAQAPHPNLLTLYDTGTRDGYHFASLEFVVGQTLQRHLAQVSQTDERFAVHVGLAIAQALTSLHGKDICHRNVKPKNIFVETHGGIRLIGLGLASCRSAFFSPHLDAHPIGTPHFMAPEMIRGQCSDPRSDLYSLGVTLYLMVAGRPPFDVAIPAAIMNQHLCEAPKPLPQSRPDVSPEFAAVVHRLIAREPEDRFQSARAAVEALEALAKARPLPSQARATPPPPLLLTTAPRLAGLSRTLAHPVCIALISVAATVLLLFALSQTAAWLWTRKADQPPAAGANNEATETMEFNRLLQSEPAFMANPTSGADAWAQFLTRFPNASVPHQQYARAKLELYLKLLNEKLLLDRLNRNANPVPPPVKAEPRPAVPPREDPDF